MKSNTLISIPNSCRYKCMCLYLISCSNISTVCMTTMYASFLLKWCNVDCAVFFNKYTVHDLTWSEIHQLYISFILLGSSSPLVAAQCMHKIFKVFHILISNIRKHEVLNNYSYCVLRTAHIDHHWVEKKQSVKARWLSQGWYNCKI